MATTLQITGWKAEGLRCPDHEVSFISDPGQVYPVSLIQMPNGTGKTTTLEILRAALGGTHPAGEWTEDRVRNLRKTNSHNAQGTFRLSLHHNEQRITITLNFDFEEGTVQYLTTLPSGQEIGFLPPRDLERFLRPGFVSFFIFDGELADHLLNHDRTDAQTTVEDLFQLGVFKRISDRVDEFWRDKALTEATEERGLTRRTNRVKKLKERIAMLEEEKKVKFREFSNLRRELEEKKKKYEKSISMHEDLDRSLQDTKLKNERAKADVDRKAHELLGEMRNPHALSSVFAKEMIDFKNSLDRVKLPESAAREFFEELSEEELCVCGRLLDDKTRQAIRDRSKQYLGSEDVALLNALKGEMATLIQPSIDAHEIKLKLTIDSLRESQKLLSDLRAEIDRILAHVNALDPEARNIKSKIDLDQQRLNLLENALKKYDDPAEAAGDDEIYGIGILKRRLEDAEKKLAEITHTIQLKMKRDILMDVLNRAHSKAREGISTDLCAEANKRIADLMPYNEIRIDKVDRCLKLRGQAGGSAGETLSVGYAFLATLFNGTDYQLPFVIDSPAGPLDVQVRPKIAQLIPSLTKQCVAFTISTEQQGFIDPLEQATQGKTQFITLFKKGRPDLEGAARLEESFKETADGICVQGKSYFKSFQLDKEDVRGAI